MASGACLDENSIVAFFESRLSVDAAARVDEHAADCEACRRVLAAYGGMAATALHRTEPVSGVTEREAGREGAGDVARLVAHAQAAKRVGTVLCGKWRIDSVLGMGGMAQVYAATHRNNGRRVAVKMIRPELAIDPSLVERFLREGYVANKVEHPGAVAVLDDDVTEDGAPFLVMELLRGRTLRTLLEERGPLPVPEALRLAEGALDVLAAAHEHGIVHRDIKPDNLFETDDGVVKVLDFGIARLREQPLAPTKTLSGTTVGTIGYMPPEQARGRVQEVDARSDVWAMGATMFALISGRAVHEADTLNEALLLAMTKPVAPIRTLVPSLDPEVSRILDKALRFDRAHRFADGRDMLGAVRAARASVATSARAPAHVVTSRTRPVAWTLGVLLAAGAGVLAYGRLARERAPVEAAASAPMSATAPEEGRAPAPAVGPDVTATPRAAPSVADTTSPNAPVAPERAPRAAPPPRGRATPPSAPSARAATATTATAPAEMPPPPATAAPERDPLGPRR